MKILLIFPKVKYHHKDLKKDNEVFLKLFGEGLSLTLPQVAAATPKKHTVEIIDENYEDLDFKKIKNYDLVGITCLTMSSNRSYEIADKIKKLKIPVVLGGNHPSALPEEAKQHADSVVVGEAEYTWPQLINDFENGCLKEFYKHKKSVLSEYIPEPRRDLIKRKYYMDGLLIKRGCPNRCEFCFITSIYNKGKRPIEHVINEIKSIPTKNIFIFDQNLTWDMTYTKKLLKKIKNINKRFFANGTINVLGNDKEFLQLSKEADLKYWYIGFESVSQESLNGAKKSHNKVEKYSNTINKIKKYGMVISGSFMFGFDQDRSKIFNETLKFLDEQGIDLAEFHIVTPYPGTQLYKRLKKENRILHEDWSKYNTANVVFKPKNMTIDELFNGVKSIAKRFYTIPKIIKRAFKAFFTTKSPYYFYYVLLRNLQYRERYKNQFNF
ncbi:hypothetical protein AYK24_02920 [Thermoplasmatales archaeon SG8-52-4]|nr:MAG: hypothetical protein AYK24_02920 [Thermoplasmatales archaeon SG8-52-4]